MAIVSAALLMLAVAAPASAASLTGVASSGSVTWRAPNWPTGITGESVFSVKDGRPGKLSTIGDWGTYSLTRPDGSLTLAVSCVQVFPGWSEFAGVVTYRTGVYVAGEVFLVSVKDSGPGGVGDEIGMRSHGYSLSSGCAAALDAKQVFRSGIVSAGDITVAIS
jgi:hypothetical protein